MWCVVRSHPAARVAITEQAAADDNDYGDNDEYEDIEEVENMEEVEDQSGSAMQPSLDSQAVATYGARDLSMIMEQSFVDADFNLCLSGILCHSYFVTIQYSFYIDTHVAHGMDCVCATLP